MEIGEIINISKINEGFFISDKLAALNPCLLMQFKISHIINATGSPIYNNFEQLGIKYFTLNWSEKSSQKLFDPQDNIATQITSFIDSALNNGQGLLAHSVKGNNRVCIVVLIFFMKRYLWTLNKSLDFLRSRKKEITIPNFFLKQLTAFEHRLIERGFQLSGSWEEKDQRNKEEMVLRNTYVNGLPVPKVESGFKDIGNKKVEWSLNLRMIANVSTDLYLQSVKKNVVSHLKCGKLKSCLKGSGNNGVNNNDEGVNNDNNNNNNNHGDDDMGFNLGKITFGPNSNLELHLDKPNDLNNNNNNINNSSNINNQALIQPSPNEHNDEYIDNPLNNKHHYDNLPPYNNNNNINIQKHNINLQSTSQPSKKRKLKTQPPNTFYTNEKPLLPKRPSSSDKAAKKLPPNSSITSSHPPPIPNQVIINNNYGQIIQTNINNFYIQNIPDNSRLMNSNYPSSPPHKTNNYLIRSTSAKPSSSHNTNNAHSIKLSPNSPSTSSQNYIESYLNNYQHRLEKLPFQQNYHQFVVRGGTTSSPGKPLNNFNPSLLRKSGGGVNSSNNSNNNPNYFNKVSRSQNVIKIKHESLRKPGTPDPVKAVYLHGNNPKNVYGNSSVAIGNAVVFQNKRVKTPTIIPHSNKNSVKRLYGYGNNGTNTSNSGKRHIEQLSMKRPGTAPNKDKTYKLHFHNSNNNIIGDNNTKLPSTLKRLPSPMIKSMSMKRDDKMQFERYRVPSPMLKSSIAFGMNKKP